MVLDFSVAWNVPSVFRASGGARQHVSMSAWHLDGGGAFLTPVSNARFTGGFSILSDTLGNTAYTIYLVDQT